MSSRRQRAATSHVTAWSRFRSWLIHHSGCLQTSLVRIFQAPLASLLTMAVLGIALALPGGLFIITKNLLNLSSSWDTDTHITIFLKQDFSDNQGKAFAETLNNAARYSSVRFLDRDQTLGEFREMTGFNEALDRLDENPLPPVILISPVDTLTADDLEPILDELRLKPEIEQVQLDLEWIRRLHSIVQILQRSLIVVFGLLALAVILVVGNTIRLEIENRRDEIVITKLFGATHAFIRRPFLYDGMWFGLLGGLFACILIVAASWLVSGPVSRLIMLYHSEFQPLYPDPLFVLSTILIGTLLGYIGAWAAVSQHLHKIEPT